LLLLLLLVVLTLLQVHRYLSHTSLLLDLIRCIPAHTPQAVHVNAQEFKSMLLVTHAYNTKARR
jgi:hypothetical protein